MNSNNIKIDALKKVVVGSLVSSVLLAGTAIAEQRYIIKFKGSVGQNTTSFSQMSSVDKQALIKENTLKVQSVGGDIKRTLLSINSVAAEMSEQKRRLALVSLTNRLLN